MKHYYVYIMTNHSKTLYTGVTNNLERRLYEHKHHLIAGFTSKYHVTRLVYFEETSDVKAALEREKCIKEVVACKEGGFDRSKQSRLARLERGMAGSITGPGEEILRCAQNDNPLRLSF